MALIWVVITSSILVLFFLIMWLRERRLAEKEYIAYGLRGDEDDENTKTNITQMESAFVEAISKLEELGEVKQDDWGQWIWTKNGKPVGSSLDNG